MNNFVDTIPESKDFIISFDYDGVLSNEDNLTALKVYDFLMKVSVLVKNFKIAIITDNTKEEFLKKLNEFPHKDLLKEPNYIVCGNKREETKKCLIHFDDNSYHYKTYNPDNWALLNVWSQIHRDYGDEEVYY